MTLLGTERKLLATSSNGTEFYDDAWLGKHLAYAALDDYVVCLAKLPGGRLEYVLLRRGDGEMVPVLASQKAEDVAVRIDMIAASRDLEQGGL